MKLGSSRSICLTKLQRSKHHLPNLATAVNAVLMTLVSSILSFSLVITVAEEND